MIRRRCEVLLLALLLDLGVPELSNRFHPVAHMGSLLSLGERLAPAGPRARLWWGGGWFAGGVVTLAALAARVPRGLLVQAVVVHTLLAYHSLDRAVATVQTALGGGDLAAARTSLGWHLVSRPTGDLPAAEVAGAAIESLAENLGDSVVAPVCAYLAGGLPLLVAYRWNNTADAMWGYRTPRYEHLGKLAARSDDLLNWLPARIAAALVVLAAQLENRRGWAAWQAAARDHGLTASPNAGWPMAAMAGALDTTLTKRGQYRLGAGAAQADPAMIARARRIARGAIVLLGAALIGGWVLSVERS